MQIVAFRCSALSLLNEVTAAGAHAAETNADISSLGRAETPRNRQRAGRRPPAALPGPSMLPMRGGLRVPRLVPDDGNMENLGQMKRSWRARKRLRIG